MGIREVNKAFEEWAPSSMHRLHGTDCEASSQSVAVHVPTRARYNDEEMGGSVFIEIDYHDAQEEIEHDGNGVRAFDGHETLMLTPDGARRFAAILTQAADAADEFRADPRKGKKHIVVCDECNAVMRSLDGKEQVRCATSQEATLQAVAHKWRNFSDEAVVCPSCRAESARDRALGMAASERQDKMDEDVLSQAESAPAPFSDVESDDDV